MPPLSADAGMVRVEVAVKSIVLFTPVVGEQQKQKRQILDNDSFDKNGTDILGRWIDKAISNLEETHREALLRQLDSGVARELGTMCSGTEAPVCVYRAVQLAAKKHDIDFTFVHKFGCDKDPTVRRFIKAVFGKQHVPKLFKDVADVASKSGFAPDAMQEDDQPTAVPLIRELVAGFPCKDVSSLLFGAHKNRAVIKDGAARTGGIFSRILEFLALHPEVESLLLENVVGLAAKASGQDHSNLDWCVALLNKFGFWVMVFKLDPRMFGMPVSRGRLWLVCIKKTILTDVGISDEEATQLAKKMMQDIVNDQPWRRMEDFLLPEDHPIIRRALDRSSTKNLQKTKQGKYSKLPAWAGKYADFVDSPSATGRSSKAAATFPKAMSWYDPVHPPDYIVDAFPHLAQLSDQHFTVLAAHGIHVTSDEAMQARSNRTCEVTQTVARTRASNPGEASIVLPNGKLYLESRGRPAVGHEGLLLQGLHFANGHDLLQEFTSDELQNLAGNAFNSYCMSAAFLIKEGVIGIARSRQHSSSSSTAPALASKIPLIHETETDETGADETGAQQAAAWKRAKKHSLSDVLSF